MSQKENDRPKISEKTPHIILCEGKDEERFLISFLNFCIKNDPRFDLFFVYNFGGTKELKNALQELPKALDMIINTTDNFSTIVKSLCIIQDAETDASATCQSICGSLKKFGFAAPAVPCSPVTDEQARYPNIRTGFLLFPGCGAKPENGTLEDLCLRILAKEDAEDILKNVDKALEPYIPLKCPHKNRLHTYFSLTNDFVGDKVGEAASKKAFRYDVPEIESLKNFLLRMAGVS